MKFFCDTNAIIRDREKIVIIFGILKSDLYHRIGTIIEFDRIRDEVPEYDFELCLIAKNPGDEFGNDKLHIFLADRIFHVGFNLSKDLADINNFK